MPIVEELSSILSHLFLCQAAEAIEQTNLDSATDNAEYLFQFNKAQLATSQATAILEAVLSTHVNFLSSFQHTDVETIQQSNKYFNMYGLKASVDNLSWSANCILNTCE